MHLMLSKCNYKPDRTDATNIGTGISFGGKDENADFWENPLKNWRYAAEELLK